MNKAILVALILVGGGFLFAGVLGIWAVGTYNGAATLKNQYTSKVSANEASFDNMWKKIQQTSQVPDAQKNALREIFEGYAAARTGVGGGGSVMNWIKEAIPSVDVSIYKDLMNIITSSRDEWTRNQVELVSIANEYNKMLAVFPSNVLLKMLGFERIEPKIITSTRTENAFKTGKDDDVELNLGKK
jgi:hypothetical protein